MLKLLKRLQKNGVYHPSLLAEIGQALRKPVIKRGDGWMFDGQYYEEGSDLERDLTAALEDAITDMEVQA